MKENLFEYVKSIKNESSDLLDLIKFNISEKVYYYGDHFKKSRPKSKVYFYVKSFLIYLYTRIVNLKVRTKSIGKSRGISGSYHNFDEQLEKNNILTLRMPQMPKKGIETFGNLSLFYNTMIIQKSFIYDDYNYLIRI